MASSKSIPGGDAGSSGDILNDFLLLDDLLTAVSTKYFAAQRLWHFVTHRQYRYEINRLLALA